MRTFQRLGIFSAISARICPILANCIAILAIGCPTSLSADCVRQKLAPCSSTTCGRVGITTARLVEGDWSAHMSTLSRMMTVGKDVVAASWIVNFGRGGNSTLRPIIARVLTSHVNSAVCHCSRTSSRQVVILITWRAICGKIVRIFWLVWMWTTHRSYPFVIGFLFAPRLVIHDIVSHLLILIDQQPKHSVHLLGLVNRNLHVIFHATNLLLHIVDTLNVVTLKLTLIRGYVLKSYLEILREFIIECLSWDLNTNSEHNLRVDDLFFQSSVKNSQVSLPRLFYGIIYLILRRHNLIQMYLIVQKVIIIQSFKRFEHFLSILLQYLNQGFVLYF